MRGKARWGEKNRACRRFGPPSRMGPRPSPFKSHCVAMLNFKNGVCILPLCSNRFSPLSFSLTLFLPRPF